MIYLHSGFTLQQQSKDSDHGECPTPLQDICTQCLGHCAPSITEKQPFVSFQLSSLERMPAALFWLSILTNKLRLLPREAHSPGKSSLTKNIRRKGEGQSKVFAQRYEYRSLSSLLADPKGYSISQYLLCLQKPYSYLFQLSIQPFTFTQGTEVSVNTDFCKSCFLKHYSSTYNSNGN